MTANQIIEGRVHGGAEELADACQVEVLVSVSRQRVALVSCNARHAGFAQRGPVAAGYNGAKAVFLQGFRQSE